MTHTAETFLRHQGIAALANSAVCGAAGVHHAHSLPAVRVAIPELATGGTFLDMLPVREWPAQGMWKNDSYESVAPPLFVVHGAIVHSQAGIVAVGDAVIGETLAGTSPDAHAYRGLAGGIGVHFNRVRHLPGIHVSALAAGSETDYRHAMLGGVARLAAVPDTCLAAATSLLVPAGGLAQREALALLDLPPSLEIREVQNGETLLVDTLVLPLTVCGTATYHPCVTTFFARLSANVAPSRARLPRRFYIDGRATGPRALRNEGELVCALAGLGFEPVRLENLSLADQVRLFRQADAIVAPHGAGLTNIGFASPGCVVIELQMDAHIDWCYRHLAAVSGVQYDCVLGRARRPWREMDARIQPTPWEVSVHHVVSAVAHGLGGYARAA